MLPLSPRIRPTCHVCLICPPLKLCPICPICQNFVSPHNIHVTSVSSVISNPFHLPCLSYLSPIETFLSTLKHVLLRNKPAKKDSFNCLIFVCSLSNCIFSCHISRITIQSMSLFLPCLLLRIIVPMSHFQLKQINMTPLMFQYLSFITLI